MPTSPPTRCTGCGALLYRGERCQTCNWSGSRYKGEGGPRTSNPQWAKIRSERLRIDPFCTWVGEGDDLICAEVATQVDHLDGTDYDDHSGQGRSWLNLDTTRSLCTDHHRKRTAQQSAMSRRQYS